MGRKDEYQFDYLEDDRRFADQINGALFNGRQIVKPEELEQDESQVVSTGEKAGAGSIQQDRQQYKKHAGSSGKCQDTRNVQSSGRGRGAIQYV